MEIRRVVPTDDFDALSRIYALSWKAAYRGIVPPNYLDKLAENRWTERLRQSEWDSLVLIKDGKYIGTSSVCPARDKTMGGWGEIISIYLLPEYFGKGYGKSLLNEAVSMLSKMGYAKIYLWVLEQNLRARAFYEKNGFTQTSDKMTLDIGGKALIEVRYIYEAQHFSGSYDIGKITLKPDVMRYEELAMNAHPALQTQLFDGWVLRFANGYTNRANSINPLYPSVLPIEKKISLCEEIYHSQGLPATYKLTPLSFDPLDNLLESKGYEKVTPTNIMTRTLAITGSPQSSAAISDKIDREWQENYFRLNGISDSLKINTAKIMQANILGKTLCATVMEKDRAIACGLCVVEREYAGLFDIIVDPEHRGKGYGFTLCDSLLNAAAQAGAKFSYLQVVADNAPAAALYEKLGFNYSYQYWYRIKKRESTK